MKSRSNIIIKSGSFPNLSTYIDPIVLSPPPSNGHKHRERQDSSSRDSKDSKDKDNKKEEKERKEKKDRKDKKYNNNKEKLHITDSLKKNEGIKIIIFWAIG